LNLVKTFKKQLKMRTVSIVGLGWLGRPLAQHLLKKGLLVKGSTTSKEKSISLREEGINTAVLHLSPHPEGEGFGNLFVADVLFVNIPPKSRTNSDAFYLEQNKFLKEMAKQADIQKVIFASSTSVYLDADFQYSEDYPLTNVNSGSPGILQAERLWFDDKEIQCSVIRFGGLLGVDRIPGRYFSGKENVVGDTPVNFIHRDDAVRLATWVIEKELFGEVFNAVAPIHSRRRDIYEKNARDLGFPAPNSYAPGGTMPSKVISSEKILETGFKFDYPDPMDFWFEI
jgi:nucleoside-diphosphate-sugar epimerase